MKKLFAFILLLISVSVFAQHLRVLVETTTLTRRFLTNDTTAQAALMLGAADTNWVTAVSNALYARTLAVTNSTQLSNVLGVSFLSSPTNSGTDGQIPSRTGTRTKWIDAATGGGTTNYSIAGTNATIITANNTNTISADVSHAEVNSASNVVRSALTSSNTVLVTRITDATNSLDTVLRALISTGNWYTNAASGGLSNLFGTIVELDGSITIPGTNATFGFGTNQIAFPDTGLSGYGYYTIENETNWVFNLTNNAAGLTNLNASELRSGTVPLARLSGITSNQIDSATDALYISGGGNSDNSGNFNIIDYGAIGDNSTANTAPIQLAINDAHTNGGTVLVPPGRYKFGAVTGFQNTIIQGNGEQASVFVGTAIGTMLLIQGDAGTYTTNSRLGPRISGITFEGANTATQGCRITDILRFEVRDCNFQSFDGTGLSIYGQNVGWVDGCRFFSNNVGLKYEAVVVPGYGSSLPPSMETVHDCVFYYNTNRAISYAGGTGLFIDHCNFEVNGMGDAGAVTIRVAADSAWGTYGLVMNNCWLEGNTGAAYVDLVNVAGPIQHSISDTFFNNYITTVPIKLGGGGAGKNTLVVNNLLSWDNFGLTANQNIVISGTNSSFRSINSSFYYVGTPDSYHRHDDGGITMQGVEDYTPYIIMDNAGQGQTKGKFTWYVGPDNSFNIASYSNTNYFQDPGQTILQLLADTGEIVAATTNRFVGDGSGLTNLTGASGLSNVTDSGYTALVRSNLVVDGTVSAVAATTAVAAFNATSPITGGLLDYAWALNAMAPNIVSNSGVMLLFGKAQSTNNSAHLAYVHSADGSTANRFSLGLFGSDNILNVFGSGGASLGSTIDPGAGGLSVGGTTFNVTNGNVGIGTNAPTEALHVLGNVLVTSNVTAKSFTGNGVELTNVSVNSTDVTVPFGDRSGLIVEGDSLMAGSGIFYHLTNSFPAWRSFGSTYYFPQNGSTIAHLTNRWETNVAPAIATMTAAGITNIFLLFDVGANNLFDSAAYFTSTWRDYVTRAHSSNVIVITFTIMPQAIFDSARFSVWFSDNQFMRQSALPDYLIDLARLFPDATDTSWFSDGTHLQQVGYQRVAQVVDSALRSASFRAVDATPQNSFNTNNIVFAPDGTVMSLANKVGVGVGLSVPQTAIDTPGIITSRSARAGTPTDPYEGLRFSLTGQAETYGTDNYRNSIFNSTTSSGANSVMAFFIANSSGSQVRTLDLFGTTDVVAYGRLATRSAAGSDPANPTESLMMSQTGNFAYDQYRNSIWNSVSSSGSLSLMQFSVANGSGTQTNVMVLNGLGNVGIGTNAPKNKLDVSGAVAIGSYAGIDTAPVNGMIVSSNVGIGTNNPSAKLHVLGDSSIRTNIAQFDVTITDFVVGTRYTNANRRSFVAASFQLAAAVAGTAAVTMNVEQAGTTNKLTVSSGPLTGLTTIEPLALLVGPGAFYYFTDTSSGAGAVATIVAGTSSQTGF